VIVRNIVILTAYVGAWAALHSVLASLGVKAWARRQLGEGVCRWYRLAFNAIALVTFAPFVALLLLLPDRVLYVIPVPWRWLTLGIQVLAALALAWTLLQTGVLRFAGMTQLVTPHGTASGPLQVRGFYCYVRHPLYVFSTILLWLMPVMTLNTAIANVLIAAYFVVGSHFEERKLRREFGAAYDEYARHVPRFIPRLQRCPPLSSEEQQAQG
jgi:protein-S-isoprenylcysteine O-methyltransferase Ste14